MERGLESVVGERPMRRKMIGWIVRTSRGEGQIMAVDRRGHHNGWAVKVKLPLAKHGWWFEASKVFIL